MIEKTLVLFKPDTVQRGITGQVLDRFERAGLKVVALKMVMVSKELAEQHYPYAREEFLKGMGGKTLKNYEENNMNPKEDLGTDDPLEIGKMINQWNIEFLTSAPVIALVLEGNDAIAKVRKVAGFTIPAMAEPGTIRGDFSADSPVLANPRKRAVHNMIHASGNLEEAQLEIGLWFKESEITQYKRADEDIMY